MRMKVGGNRLPGKKRKDVIERPERTQPCLWRNILIGMPGRYRDQNNLWRDPEREVDGQGVKGICAGGGGG